VMMEPTTLTLAAKRSGRNFHFRWLIDRQHTPERL
jgi:hypothetical protein